MFPLSTPFLLTKPGERMIMYLCSRDIDVSSFYTFSIDQPGERSPRDIDVSSFYTFSIDQARERIMYLCARDIDVSSFYTFSIDQARRENDHVFVF